MQINDHRRFALENTFARIVSSLSKRFRPRGITTRRNSRPPSEATFRFVALEYLVSCIEILAHGGKRFGPNAVFDAMYKIGMLR